MKRILKFSGTIAAVVAVVCGGVFLWGALLSSEYTADAKIVVAANPPDVWDAVTSPEGQSEWRTSVNSVEHIPHGWIEHTPSGKVRVESKLEQPYSRFRIQLEESGADVSGTREFKFESVQGGTRVTVTEQGRVSSPVSRFLLAVVLGYDYTLRQYLGDLKAHVESGGSDSK